MNTYQLNQHTFKYIPKQYRKLIRELQQVMGWTDHQLFNSGWSYNPKPSTGQFSIS